MHAQFLSMTHDLPLPALIRSEGQSAKMTKGEKYLCLSIHFVAGSPEAVGWVVEGWEQRPDLIAGPGA